MRSFLTEHLPPFLLWTGIVVALLASLVVAPAAPGRLVKWIRDPAVGLIDRLLRRSRTIDITTAGASAGSGTLSVEFRVDPWNPNADLETRVQALRDQVIELRTSIATTDQKLRTELDRVYNAVMADLEALRGKLSKLQDEVAASERQSIEVDARGLLPIGFGILLSGAPDELAHAPWWLGGPWFGVALVLCGMAASVSCLVVLWKHYRKARRNPSGLATGGTT